MNLMYCHHVYLLPRLDPIINCVKKTNCTMHSDMLKSRFNENHNFPLLSKEVSITKTPKCFKYSWIYAVYPNIYCIQIWKSCTRRVLESLLYITLYLFKFDAIKRHNRLTVLVCNLQSIEWLCSSYAFSPSNDLAPPPPPPPVYRQQASCLSFQSSCVSPFELTDGRGGRDPSRTTARKLGPLEIIQYSLNIVN